MKHPAEYTLEYLESADCKNEVWAEYIKRRSLEVLSYIDTLRNYADLKPGSTVYHAVHDKADHILIRISNVLIGAGLFD